MSRTVAARGWGMGKWGETLAKEYKLPVIRCVGSGDQSDCTVYVGRSEAFSPHTHKK